MARRYYSLAVFSPEQSRFMVEFSSYFKNQVIAEKQTHLEHDHRQADLFVLVSDDNERAILAALAALNAKASPEKPLGTRKQKSALVKALERRS